MENLRQHGEVTGFGNHFQPGNDGNRNADLPAFAFKIEKVLVVEKHLGYDVVGTGLHLLFKPHKVPVHVRGLDVLLGITAHADAKIGFGRFQHVFQIHALVHPADLTNQIYRVFVGFPVFMMRLGGTGIVAAYGQHILDAQIVQLDQRVFGLLAGKTLADDVGNRLHVIPVLDRRAETYRTGTLPFDVPLHTAIAEFLIVGLRRVGGHINEGRIELHHLVERFEHGLYGTAPFRGDDLKGDQRFFGLIV